ncbi:family 43 glycosylhydrolase [Microbacterium insulae]|uniref:Family 43 glycosylhydrolase n=1 Tax=Microbacterium insulae TaxID=483014 RepID=A0ABW3AF41_9MICO
MLVAVTAVIAALTLSQLTGVDSASAATSYTVSHSEVTTTKGTLNKTYYQGTWGATSRSHYAPAGSSFEIVFDGSKLELYGLTDVGHGTGRVFVDGVEVGMANYRAAKNSTARVLFTKDGLAEGRHVLLVQVEGGYIDHASAVFTTNTTPAPTADDLTNAVRAAAVKVEGDHTPASWPAFRDARTAATALGTGGTAAERAAALAQLKSATAALVEVGGLRDLIADYSTRVPSDYTEASWQPFASALSAAQDLEGTSSSTNAEVVAAKSALQSAAAGLDALTTGTFEPITNNTFWTDTDGNPIYSQGGGIFQFGDTYYWYGVHYKEAETYRNSPTRAYNTSTFASIPVYSSKDLVNWNFENDVATTSTPITVPESQGTYFAKMQTLADAIWVGRLGVVYNENTGKYVLMVQSGQGFEPDTSKRGMVLFLQGDSPTDDFDYGNIQPQITNVPTNSTGDQTVFTDDDGTDYLIFSNSSGRANAYVGKIAPSDSLSIEPAVHVNRVNGGREGNAMFKLNGKYYMLTSDLHGWNSSVNHVIESLTGDIQGTYSPEYTLKGTEKDYSLVTQTGFFVTIHGTEQDTVLYAGDRWANFAWNGIGYNQWVPLSYDNDELSFNALTHWELNAVTGEWRVGANNNYVRNPDFAADRIAVTNVTGWTTTVDADSATSAFVSNPGPGADSSRFALQLGAAGAFSGSVSQENEVPGGVYTFRAKVNTAGGLEYARVVIRGENGQRHTVDLNNATSGWASVEARDMKISGGVATISVEARSAGGNQNVRVDSLSLVRQATDSAALQSVYDDTESASVSDYSAASWSPFADARTHAGSVLAAATSTQAEIDAAASALTAARDGLVSAVTSVSVTTSKALYAVGAPFQPETLTVTTRKTDGTEAQLGDGQYTVAGFSSAQAGEKTLTVTVSSQLTATGAAATTTTVKVTVLAAWSATTAYNTGQKVLFADAIWLASWWTKNQKPGDPYGPWQEIREQAGVAVWTSSRIFNTGDVVIHNGNKYVAKWWTRNQAPGDPNGPWKPATP